MSFEEMGLSQGLLSAIKKQGYTAPTPIQAKAIPTILAGRDVMATAQTGTGKTAGFTLPILQRLLDEPCAQKRVRVLVMTPTRELAAQVHESVQAYGHDLPFKACALYGGVSIYGQKMRLKKKPEIIMATPGRLLDLIRQRAIQLSSVETVVLDEADRMLDMGFIDDIQEILNLLPKKRQSLLFSATFSKEIKAFAQRILHEPAQIDVVGGVKAADNVKQLVHPVDKQRKRALLSYLIGSENWGQVLVFVRTKHGAERLAEQLSGDGLRSDAIHGDRSQGARNRALANFKSGKTQVLVATDVAARGLDIQKLPYVVNFDMPQVPEDYVHRIGRTGRASEEGVALSLVSHDEVNLLARIEELLKKRIPQEVVERFEPDTPLSKPRMARGKKRGSVRKNAAKGRGRFAKSGARRSSEGEGRSSGGRKRVAGGRGRDRDDSERSEGRSTGYKKPGARRSSEGEGRSTGGRKRVAGGRSRGRDDSERSEGRSTGYKKRGPAGARRSSEGEGRSSGNRQRAAGGRGRDDSGRSEGRSTGYKKRGPAGARGSSGGEGRSSGGRKRVAGGRGDTKRTDRASHGKKRAPTKR